MYNGIGLETPRGSGTNGYVQRNLAFARVQKDRNSYKTEDEINIAEARMFREPNKEILEHERKRRIENKVVEMEDLMEEQGYSAEEIADKVTKYRQFLLEKEGECDLNNQKTEDGRVFAKGSHEMRAVTQQKNALFRDAVRIDNNFVEGTSMQKQKEKKDAELVKMITTGNFAILSDSSDKEQSKSKTSDDKKAKKSSKKKKQSSKKKRKRKLSSDRSGGDSGSESHHSDKSDSPPPPKNKQSEKKEKGKINPDAVKKKKQSDIDREEAAFLARNQQNFDKRYGWASQKEKEKEQRYSSGRDDVRRNFNEKRDRRYSPDNRDRRAQRELEYGGDQNRARDSRLRHDSESRKSKLPDRDNVPTRDRSGDDKSPVNKRSRLQEETQSSKSRHQPADDSTKRHKSKKSKHTDLDKESESQKRHKKHDKTKKKRRRSPSLD